MKESRNLELEEEEEELLHNTYEDKEVIAYIPGSRNCIRKHGVLVTRCPGRRVPARKK